MKKSVSCFKGIRFAVLLVSTMTVAACAADSPSPVGPQVFTRAAVQSLAGTGTIEIVQGGVGMGRVISDPAGINCTLGTGGDPGTCSATFPAGTVVRLHAKPAPGSTFDGWAPSTTCRHPKNLVVQDGGTIDCQPVFSIQ